MQKCIKHHIPFSTVFEITYRCNLRCRHCYQVKRNIQELRFCEIQKLLDNLSDLGCLYLAFTGGEPLARKEFFQIAQYAREKNFALKLLTNATLIDNSVAKKIKNLNFECIDISIYGATPETHDHFTGIKGSFNKMLKGVKNLRIHNVDIRFKMTINYLNVDEINKVKALAKKFNALFIAEPFITPKNNFNQGPLKYRIKYQDADKVARYFIKANQKLFCEEQSVGLICNSARGVMAVSPNGDIYPCEGLQISAGNVRKKSLKKIWLNSAVLKKIRDLREQDFYDCFRCRAKKVCFRCMGLPYLVHKDYLTKADIFCQLAKAIKRNLKRGKIPPNN